MLTKEVTYTQENTICNQGGRIFILLFLLSSLDDQILEKHKPTGTIRKTHHQGKGCWSVEQSLGCQQIHEDKQINLGCPQLSGVLFY